jgi:hypothetical protein
MSLGHSVTRRLSQNTILLKKAVARNVGYCHPPSGKQAVRSPPVADIPRTTLRSVHSAE